jgi:hypothetical protein
LIVKRNSKQELQQPKQPERLSLGSNQTPQTPC